MAVGRRKTGAPELRVVPSSATTGFDEARLNEIGQRLRTAFVARYGPELGDEVTAECLAWAWENQSQLAAMHNPVGYLFRVGQSRSRRFFRWKRERVRFPAERAGNDQQVWAEPGLDAALAELNDDERTAVVLVHCLQWTYAEVCDVLDVPLHTVRNLIHRGLGRLRDELGVDQ